MPTIVRFAGYRAVIYPNDHRPEHVHVIGKGVEAVFEVNCPHGDIELRENYAASRKQVSQMRRELNKFQDPICKAWEEIHGER
jgi:Domain of unknown function (DUF4160)